MYIINKQQITNIWSTYFKEITIANTNKNTNVNAITNEIANAKVNKNKK